MKNNMRSLKIFLQFTILISIIAFSEDSFADNDKTEGKNSPNQTYSCKILPEFLYGCEEFKCASPVPNRRVIIEQEIKGLGKDGLCLHEQTTPEGDIVICNYSEESRKFLSLSMQKNKPSVLGQAAIDPREQFLAMEIFKNECTVIETDKKDDDNEDSRIYIDEDLMKNN
jgi:hypothetical protein